MRSDARCSSCQAPIRWAVHATTGNRMPLDPLATPDGNVTICEWREAGVFPLPVVQVGAHDGITPYRYRAHFATCPNGPAHRKKSVAKG